MSKNTIIDNHYKITALLTEDNQNICYEAIDLHDNKLVHLKAFFLANVEDKYLIKSLQQEVEYLKKLEHPKIPKYIDCFQGKTKQDQNKFYVVQELPVGETLQKRIQKKWHPKQEEIQKIAIQLLRIIADLQVFTPAIVHGNIKPENIIIDSENKLYLINFAILRKISKEELNNAKFYTYSQVEKEKNTGVLSTDLYSLGQTLLFLLTGETDLHLLQSQEKKKWYQDIRIATNFAQWLEKMLEKDERKKFKSAREALDILRQNTVLVSNKPIKPDKTKVLIDKKDNKLVIKIPPVFFKTKESFILSILPFLLIILRLIVLIFILISMGTLLKNSSTFNFADDWPKIKNFLFLLLEYCFFELMINLLIRNFLFAGIFKTSLEITPQYWGIKQKILFWKFKKIKRKTKDIVSIKVKKFKFFWSKEELTFLNFGLLKDQEKFGLFLSKIENEWILAEIKYFLSHYKI